MEWIHVGCAVRLPQAHFGDPKMKKEIELPGYLSDMWQGVSFILYIIMTVYPIAYTCQLAL